MCRELGKLCIPTQTIGFNALQCIAPSEAFTSQIYGQSMQQPMKTPQVMRRGVDHFQRGCSALARCNTSVSLLQLEALRTIAAFSLTAIFPSGHSETLAPLGAPPLLVEPVR